MKPICVKDRRFYRIVKAGIAFVEGMPRDRDAVAGTSTPGRWGPYKLWSGDLWRCPDCGHELISGVGMMPIAEHFQPDFAEKASQCGATIQINDC